MAAKKPQTEPVLKSWTEADAALREIREIDSRVAPLQARHNTAVAKLTDALTQALGEDPNRKARLEKDLEEFCRAHMEELLPARSRDLNHGRIAFTSSKEVATIPKVTWAAALQIMLQPLQDALAKLADKMARRYVRLKPEINKAAVQDDYNSQKITDAKLAELGLRMEEKHNFTYELKDNDARPTV